MVSATPRVNGQIQASHIRVVTEDGTELGIYEFADACRLAQDRSLGLVEIGPTEQPPRCCLMDYGRFRYQQRNAGDHGTQTI
jgi:translation initiation factor IF-3